MTKLRMPENPAAITRYIKDIDNTVARLVDLGFLLQSEELMLHIVKSIDNLKDRSQQILRNQSWTQLKTQLRTIAIMEQANNHASTKPTKRQREQSSSSETCTYCTQKGFNAKGHTEDVCRKRSAHKLTIKPHIRRSQKTSRRNQFPR